MSEPHPSLRYQSCTVGLGRGRLGLGLVGVIGLELVLGFGFGFGLGVALGLGLALEFGLEQGLGTVIETRERPLGACGDRLAY